MYLLSSYSRNGKKIMMKLQLKRCLNREENSVGDEVSCSLPKVYLYILWSTWVHKPLRGD